MRVPVWQLLGGKVRERVKVYGWIGGDHPSEVVSAAEARKAQGFTAVKMNATGEETCNVPTIMVLISDRRCNIMDRLARAPTRYSRTCQAGQVSSNLRLPRSRNQRNMFRSVGLDVGVLLAIVRCLYPVVADIFGGFGLRAGVSFAGWSEIRHAGFLNGRGR